MNHAITIGGMVGALLFIAALVCFGVGAIAVLAGGMSDAPEAGDGATRTGCFVFIVGVVLLALSIWMFG